MPLPRFVSLKSDKVNVRAGPTKDHDVAWVYNRAALPVEVGFLTDRLAKVRHPDRFARLGPAAVATATIAFERLREAYAVLSA